MENTTQKGVIPPPFRWNSPHKRWGVPHYLGGVYHLNGGGEPTFQVASPPSIPSGGGAPPKVGGEPEVPHLLAGVIGGEHICRENGAPPHSEANGGAASIPLIQLNISRWEE